MDDPMAAKTSCSPQKKRSTAVNPLFLDTLKHLVASLSSRLYPMVSPDCAIYCKHM